MKWPARVPRIGRRSSARRGMVTVVALVAVAVVGALSLAALKAGWLARHSLDDHQRRSQAGWLVEAGMSRAAARLSEDSEYRGETWQVSLSEPPAASDGLVVIQVRPADQPGAWLVDVVAEYPVGQTLRARRQKQLQRTWRSGEE